MFDGATAHLAAEGVERKQARELAIGMIAALEGAFVLARALRSTEALDVAGKLMAARMETALGR